ncbi:MAG: tetratricopeptide repeat protein, partial [Candidatus Krumholzibacteria bacterium]|nr:tetratricopeptide repeat protein [Candidatus Krumholzibacteria bacterium]
MLSTRKSRGALVTGVACAAIVLASLAGLGCQSDEGTRTDKIIVRNPQKSRPVSTLALPSPPAIDTTSIPTRPVDDAVSVPSVPQEVTYEEAEAAFNERRYERAVELFTQYTGRKTENPWGHYMLGLSAWKAGDYARAEQALQQAIELDPLHVKSWLNLGRVFLDTDRPSEALDRIDQALSIDNQSGVAYRLQGRAFRQLGQKNDAVRAYRQAIQLDDQDAWS